MAGESSVRPETGSMLGMHWLRKGIGHSKASTGWCRHLRSLFRQVGGKSSPSPLLRNMPVAEARGLNPGPILPTAGIAGIQDGTSCTCEEGRFPGTERFRTGRAFLQPAPQTRLVAHCPPVFSLSPGDYRDGRHLQKGGQRFFPARVYMMST